MKQNRALIIEGSRLPPINYFWPLKNKFNKKCGHISSITWSPFYKYNVAIGMVTRDSWEPNSKIIVPTPIGERPVIVREKFWS